MSAPAIISSGTAAGGPPVGGSGTSSPSTIPRWTGPSTLGDSGLTDDGTTITAANRALSWTRTSGLVGTFNRQDGNEAILALATSGAVRGYVGAGASKAFNVFNAAATSELVTVLNGGNVGIGTASPGAQLHIERAGGATANAEYIRLRNTTNATGSNVSLAFYTSNNAVSTGFISHTTATGPSYDTTFSNWNGSTAAEVMRIVGSTGNVGIGTASPGTKLDVADTGAPSGTTGIRSLYTGAIAANQGGVVALGGYWTGTAPTTFAYIVGGKDNATQGDFAGHLQFWTRPNGGVYTERARIDSAGNFGIGTASPNAILSVYNAGTPTISLWNSSNYSRLATNTNDLYIDAGLGGAAGAVIFRRGSGTVDSARIDSAGRWYVGNTTAVPASGSVWVVINQPGSAGGQEWHNSSASPGGAAIVPSQNRATWYVYQNAVGSEAYSQSCVFTPTGIDLTGASATPGLKLPATPGNADPNTLDCYADGGTANSGGVTWTPTLKFGGNTTGITYNTQMGRYTRIGNMVFATCYVRLTSKGSATGAATIDGLPTSANLAGLYAAGTIGFISAITSTGTMEAYITPNSSQITLRQVDIAGTNAATTDVNFANTSEIIISIAYSVN